METQQFLMLVLVVVVAGGIALFHIVTKVKDDQEPK